jgi:hypothetical protein
MQIKHFKILWRFMMGVIIWAILNGAAQAQNSCSPLDSTGYVFLHPYFAGKNWKTSFEDNIDLVLPDTLCTQQLRPLRFDIGKSIDSTLAAFSTANGGLFIMGTQYFHFAGACQDEIDFLSPQKVPLTGIAFAGTTPWYLVKDTAFNLDTVKIVLGVNGQYCLVATIKTSADAIVKIDTLHMQNTNTIFAIQGGYDAVLARDTCIWVTGNNGMVRRFPYKRTSWGAEVKNDITATETVRCANNSYAGTSSGKIYVRNGGSWGVDYSASANAVNALYPQGALCNNGSFIENVSGSWSSGYTLGAGNYQYANFIKTPGGFGIELLDNQWKYSTFTYRNNVSRIFLTNPVDIMVNNVNKTQSPYVYNSAKIAAPKDTTISVYISDPDSNYSDVTVTLNLSSLENDGTHSVSSIPDSESCHVGVLRLTDGILRITLKKDSVVLKTQTMLGVENVGCLVCNWKSYSLSVSRHWIANNSMIITAGIDRLVIVNQTGAVTPVGIKNVNNSTRNALFKIIGNNLILRSTGSVHEKIESIALFDFSGRKLATFQNVQQSTFEIPHSLTNSVACLSIKYADGFTERQVLSLVR